MSRSPAVLALTFVVALGLTGCSVDRSGLLPPGSRDGAIPDAGERDAMPGTEDAGPRDGGGDIDGGPSMIDGGPERVDAGSLDAGSLDAGPPDAGSLDAGPPDAGPPDAGLPDAGPPDAGPPDAGPPDAGPPSCGTLYSSVRQYSLCHERAAECEFYANPYGYESCDTVCSSVGGTCVRAYREHWSDACMRDGEHPCSDSNNDDICVCTRFHP